jgi:hypothetical protein
LRRLFCHRGQRGKERDKRKAKREKQKKEKGRSERVFEGRTAWVKEKRFYPSYENTKYVSTIRS